MNKYFEITVRQNPDIPAPVVLSHVFQEIHRILGTKKITGVGVSFPEHQPKQIGTTLRVHGTDQDFDLLLSEASLNDMKDYVTVTPVQDVPRSVEGYRTVRRVQKKTPLNYYKRAVRRGIITLEEAEIRLAESTYERPKLPFLKIKSLSNGNAMHLFIKHCDIVDEPVAGEFGSYGLSPTATVPWF